MQQTLLSLCLKNCILPSHHLNGGDGDDSHYCERCLRNYTDRVISSRDLEFIQVSVMREQQLKGKLKRDDDHTGTGNREGAEWTDRIGLLNCGSIRYEKGAHARDDAGSVTSEAPSNASKVQSSREKDLLAPIGGIQAFFP